MSKIKKEILQDGFVFILRKVMDSAIWANINDWRLAETLILMANWKPGEFASRNGDIIKVERGELVTSIASLIKKSMLSFQEIRTSLVHLEKAGFLTSTSTSHFRHIKIINYRDFQDLDFLLNKDFNKDLTRTQQGLNNDIKKGSKERQEILPSADALGLAQQLAFRATENDPGLTVSTERIRKWSLEADLLLKKDCRPASEALAVLNWCQSSSFWKSNILSMGKFREKYPTLRLQMQADTQTEEIKKNDPRFA